MSVRSPYPPASGGLLVALSAIGRTLGETVRVRGALLGVELREEIERRKHRLVLVGLAAVFLHMALLLLTVLVAALFWETHRIGAIAALAVAYLACGAVALIRLRVAVAESPAPFAASLGELDKDLASLRPLP